MLTNNENWQIVGAQKVPDKVNDVYSGRGGFS